MQVTLSFVCVSAIIFAVGPYRCAAVNSCDVCKAHFDAVNFYFSNGVNPVQSNVVARCVLYLGTGDDLEDLCTDYYNTNFNSVISTLETNPDTDSATACSSVCNSLIFFQSINRIMQQGKRVYGANKMFGSTMSFDSDAVSMQSHHCTVCKIIAHTASVTLSNLRENENTLEDSVTFDQCLKTWPAVTTEQKPFWYKTCVCKILARDLLKSELLGGDETDEAICEHIGHCASCKQDLLQILSMKHRLSSGKK